MIWNSHKPCDHCLPVQHMTTPTPCPSQVFHSEKPGGGHLIISLPMNLANDKYRIALLINYSSSLFSFHLNGFIHFSFMVELFH